MNVDGVSWGNSHGRSLTPNSASPFDSESLTPSHLLLFRSNLTLLPGVFVKNDLYCQNCWKQVQYLADLYWRRLLSECLPNLKERQKWIRPRHNFAVSDLVLIADKRVQPGRDGFIRSVKVATKSSTTRELTPDKGLYLIYLNMVLFFESENAFEFVHQMCFTFEH